MHQLLILRNSVSKNTENAKNYLFLKKIVNLFKKIQKTSCKIEKKIV